MMKLKKGGVRGNNKLSRGLNRPIKGKLAKETSRRLITIVLSLVILIIWAVSVAKLGFEDGTMVTLVIAGIVIFGELKVRWQLAQVEKHKKTIRDDE